MSDPDPGRSALDRGSALLDLGRSDEAVDVLRQAVAAEPDAVEPRCQLALALLRSGENREALQLAESAAAVDPLEEWTHRLRALALMRLGRDKQAVEAAEEAVRLEPDLAVTHEILADARRAAGDRRGARAAAATAIELDPESAGPYVSLSLIDIDEERMADAERHARKALELDPENADALNNLGVALQALGGRDDEARDAFERAARLSPSHKIARENLAASSRAFVNGALALLILSFLVVRGLALTIDPDEAGQRAAGIGMLALAVVLSLFFAYRRRRRLQQPSPGAQELLSRQRWWERIEITRWRPWFLLIPSPIYFLIGLAICVGFAIVRLSPDAPAWSAGDWAVAAVVGLLTAFSGWRSVRYLRRRGWVRF